MVDAPERLLREDALRGPTSSLRLCVDLASRSVVELQRCFDDRRGAQQRQKNELVEQAEHERDQLSQLLQDSRSRGEALEARAVAAESALLQARAENEILKGALEDLEKELESRSANVDVATGVSPESQQECSELRSAVEDLSERVLVILDERDVARANEEEMFYKLSLKDEELMQAHKSYVDLTQRLQEKELEGEATDMMFGEMSQIGQQLQDTQSDVARLTAANKALQSERDELSKKKKKLEKKKDELTAKLEESETARRAARDRCAKMLERRKSEIMEDDIGTMVGASVTESYDVTGATHRSSQSGVTPPSSRLGDQAPRSEVPEDSPRWCTPRGTDQRKASWASTNNAMASLQRQGC